MKKVLSLILSLVIAITALASVNITAFAKNKYSNALDAYSYTIGKTFNGKFTNKSYKNDRDNIQFIKFTLKKPSQLRFVLKVQSGIDDTNFDTYIYNKDDLKNEIYYYQTYYEDNYERIYLDTNTLDMPKLTLNAGTYYIKFTSPAYEKSFTYTAKFTAKELKESIPEKQAGSNNTFKTASKISVDKAYTGVFAYNDNIDYYKFDVKKEGYYTLDFSGKCCMSMMWGSYVKILTPSKKCKIDDRASLDFDKNCAVYKGSVKLTKGTYYLYIGDIDGTAWSSAVGNYSFTIKRVNPGKSSVKSLSGISKGINVTLNSAKDITGYEIMCATDSSFKKDVKTATSKSTSKAIKKLLPGKKYYVKVRTYKTITLANGDTKKVYSAWSSAKSVTTKK